MDLASYFPMWDRLTEEQREKLVQSVLHRSVKKGTILYDGTADCPGLLLIQSGQLRAYIFSAEGREITMYRLFEMDVCLLAASCVNVQFDITIEAEKDSEIWTIPPYIFKKLMEESASIANYCNQLIASRFSEVMWLVEQIMWKSFDKRLAAFLLEESTLEGTMELKLTHEKIANHMGTAREVVTRMLRYFQSEGMVKLTRGTVEILDAKRLERLNSA